MILVLPCRNLVAPALPRSAFKPGDALRLHPWLLRTPWLRGWWMSKLQSQVASCGLNCQTFMPHLTFDVSDARCDGVRRYSIRCGCDQEVEKSKSRSCQVHCTIPRQRFKLRHDVCLFPLSWSPSRVERRVGLPVHLSFGTFLLV
jgi:hypothetical protein